MEMRMVEDHKTILAGYDHYVTKTGEVILDNNGDVQIYGFEFNGLTVSEAKQLILYRTIAKLQQIYIDLVESSDNYEITKD